jgi:hypothetical protein
MVGISASFCGRERHISSSKGIIDDDLQAIVDISLEKSQFGDDAVNVSVTILEHLQFKFLCKSWRVLGKLLAVHVRHKDSSDILFWRTRKRRPGLVKRPAW